MESEEDAEDKPAGDGIAESSVSGVQAEAATEGGNVAVTKVEGGDVENVTSKMEGSFPYLAS